MAFDEMTIINQIANYERSIAGVKNSYGFAQNPDALTNAMLPAAIHYSASFSCVLLANYGKWQNSITMTSILFVKPREQLGGKLKFLENEAMPFANLWRAKFQDPVVITALLTNTQAVKAYLTGGAYGAGGALLTYNGVEFIGYVINFDFLSN